MDLTQDTVRARGGWLGLGTDTTEEDKVSLPSGHPLMWGLLTRGTYLDGEPYLPMVSAAASLPC
jgi:hypothetical protein